MKKSEICRTCIDSNCAVRDSLEASKMNCPADKDVPVIESETPAKRHEELGLFDLLKLRKKLEPRLKNLHRACAECSSIFITCCGLTLAEWSEIEERDTRNEDHVPNDFCMSIALWEDKNRSSIEGF